MAFLDIRAGVVLAISAVVLAPVAVFAPNGTVVVLCAAGAVLAFDPRHRRAALAMVGSPEHRLIAALLLLGAVAASWSFDPSRGLFLALRLALLTGFGTLVLAAAAGLSPPEARIAHRFMAMGGVLLIGLMLIETTSGAALTQFFRGIDADQLQGLSNGAPLSRGGIVLALFLWPALVLLPAWYGRASLVVAIPAAAVALWLQPTQATLIAALLGAAVFLAAHVVPRPWLRRAAWLAVLALLAAPLVAAALPWLYDPASLAALPQSHAHRVQIWSFALERILERPVFGWGFDSARELMGVGGEAVFGAAPMSTHPHNVSLQAWLELGLAGLALVAALAFALWRRAAGGSRARTGAAAALAGFAAWLVYAEISRGAWQYWWLAALWLFAAWIAALGRETD